MRFIPAIFLMASVSCGFAPDDELVRNTTYDFLYDGRPDPGVAPPPDSALAICSRLPFDPAIDWDTGLTSNDREAVKLALNISGSFEGSSGWANLTNDFDGQGMSMGLLNQTLGTGSLQPLLLKARSAHPALMQSIYSASHLSSLYGMLDRYAKAIVTTTKASPLDFMSELKSLAATPESESVSWARANLYVNGRFIDSWKRELQMMAETPEYVSIQINRALDYHRSALNLQSKIGIKQLRAYLLMFDFVVQNGSLYKQDLADFEAYRAAHPDATVLDQLKQILALRLRWVKPEYVEDVKSRKLAIIYGNGVVHGDTRHFESEYCFNRLMSYGL